MCLLILIAADGESCRDYTKGASFHQVAVIGHQTLKFSSFQSSHLTLSQFWRTLTAIPGMGTCLPRFTFSYINGPPSTRAQLSLLCDLTQGGQSPNTAAVCQRKNLNVWLLRVICLSVSRHQLPYHRKFGRSHWHTHTAGLSISSASASKRHWETESVRY